VIKNFCKYIGEWHEEKLHGIAKIERDSGVNWWSQFKHGSRKGYFTMKYPDGRADYL